MHEFEYGFHTINSNRKRRKGLVRAISREVPILKLTYKW